MKTRLLLVAVLALAAGCGEDSDEGGACEGDFTACGGDVLGTWTIESGCLYAVTPVNYGNDPACLGVPTTLQASYTAGTIEFRADGTSESRLTTNSTETVELEDDCLEALAGQAPSATCAQLNAPVADPDTGEVVGQNDCTYGGGACRCVATVDLVDRVTTAAYEVAGTEIRSPGASRGDPFCVADDRLEMRGSAPGGAVYVALVRSP